ncbi:MAG: hypothetical protein KDD47_22000 [Acidobacteria bacterium]|nr:hypothetical protein [Acidobacteriota bacterium]
MRVPLSFRRYPAPRRYPESVHLPWRSLAALLALLLVAGLGSTAAASPVVLDETVEMICFPPQAMQPPPCPVPVGIDPDLVAPDPGGEMRIRVREDDQTTINVRLRGMSAHQVATAFFVHFPPNQPPPHPVFAPIGPGLPPVAHMDTPVAHTRARFSEGLGREPNGIPIRRNGDGHLWVELDYNPLKSGQVPLVNGMTLTQQGLAPAGSPADRRGRCRRFPPSRSQADPERGSAKAPPELHREHPRGTRKSLGSSSPLRLQQALAGTWGIRRLRGPPGCLWRGTAVVPQSCRIRVWRIDRRCTLW